MARGDCHRCCCCCWLPTCAYGTDGSKLDQMCDNRFDCMPIGHNSKRDLEANK